MFIMTKENTVDKYLKKQEICFLLPEIIGDYIGKLRMQINLLLSLLFQIVS